MNFFAEQKLTQTLKNLVFDGGQVAEGWAGGLGEKCKTGL